MPTDKPAKKARKKADPKRWKTTPQRSIRVKDEDWESILARAQAKGHAGAAAYLLELHRIDLLTEDASQWPPNPAYALKSPTDSQAQETAEAKTGTSARSG